MNKLQIRQQVVEQSGRYDLVGTQVVAGENVPNYVIDAGVDKYINSAIETLSREIKVEQNLTHFYGEVDSDTAGLFTKKLVKIKDVSYDGSPLGFTNQYQVARFLHSGYAYEGPPEAWFTLTTESPLKDDSEYEWDEGVPCTIGIFPVPDDTYEILVTCWIIDTLDDTGDSNWWTINEPKTVVDLACAEIDASVANADRRVIDYTIDRVKRNLISRDIDEETYHHSGSIL